MVKPCWSTAREALWDWSLCSHILRLGCRKLIVLDRYEAYLTNLWPGCWAFSPATKSCRVPVGPDQADVFQDVFLKYRPEVVFQTAMNKYIPFIDSNTGEVVRTNYRRTFGLARMAQNSGCGYFVVISSFSATAGGHLVADTLRIAELSLQAIFAGSTCRLIISRICDVVENRGGLVAIIENQIRKQETIILPSPTAEACLISKLPPPSSSCRPWSKPAAAMAARAFTSVKPVRPSGCWILQQSLPVFMV